MLAPQQTAGASRNSSPLGAAQIVATSNVSHTTAQAPSLTHCRSGSSSNNNFDAACVTAEAGAPSRGLRSPSSVPTSTLPPAPRLETRRLSDKSSTGAVAKSPVPLSKSIRRALRQISAGLTQDEQAELVQKILNDLRPAHLAPISRSVSLSASITRAAVSQQLATHKMAPGQSQSVDSAISSVKRLNSVKRLSSRSQSDDSTVSGHVSSSSSGNDDKLSHSKSSTPPLSQSRTPTPTTPATPMCRIQTDDKAAQDYITSKPVTTDSDKPLLTPISALESLRVLENSFEQSAVSLILDDAPKDNSVALALASPTKSAHGDKEPAPISPISSVPASPTRPKRNSSYRKSVPTLDDLASGSKRPSASGRDRHRTYSTISVSSQPPVSPSGTHTHTAPWISSLTTSEAIRVLAFQQDAIEAASASESQPAEKVAASSDEVSALRYALKFALARSDKLSEALNRAIEDKRKVEEELEILRQNVLRMLSSKSVVRSPERAKSPELHADKTKRIPTRTQTSEEEDTDQFEDAHSRQGHGASLAVERPKVSSPKKQVSIDLEPRPPSASGGVTGASRPSRSAIVTSASKAVAPATAPSAPSQPSGGVSIASLRKKQASAATSGPAQRYSPPRKALDLEADPADQDEDDEDDDEFDMYPFHQSRRRALPEVSMADFLNASRMSKSELQQHDARRELEREDASGWSLSSHSSHSPLTGAPAARRSIFKGIGKLVDTKRSTRRTDASSISKPSLVSIHSASVSKDTAQLSRSASYKGHHLTYSEESIIPSYPARAAGSSVSPRTTAMAAEERLRAMSTHSSLRESLEKQSLWEAGIRA